MISVAVMYSSREYPYSIENHGKFKNFKITNFKSRVFIIFFKGKYEAKLEFPQW